MRYWDNDFDREFDEALDELIKEEQELKAKMQDTYISNPQKLIGAI